MWKPQAVGDSCGDVDRPVGSGSHNPGNPSRARQPFDRRLVLRGKDRAPVRMPETGSLGIAVDGDHVQGALAGGAEQAELCRPGA
jgi:hypothetical protein